MAEAIKSGQLRIEGDASKVTALMSMLDRFDAMRSPSAPSFRPTGGIWC